MLVLFNPIRQYITLRVLELGRGTGLLGMLASHLNAKMVALTDGDPIAVHNLQQNLSNSVNSIDTSNVKACALLWGEQPIREREGNDDDQLNDSDFECWCRQNFFESWKRDEEVKFDVILAGDVMYKTDKRYVIE